MFMCKPEDMSNQCIVMWNVSNSLICMYTYVATYICMYAAVTCISSILQVEHLAYGRCACLIVQVFYRY